MLAHLPLPAPQAGAGGEGEERGGEGRGGEWGRGGEEGEWGREGEAEEKVSYSRGFFGDIYFREFREFQLVAKIY